MSNDERAQAEAALKASADGFDHLFSNELEKARTTMAAGDSPFHLLGLGVCQFLEAALALEFNLMADATTALTAAEAGAKQKVKSASSSSSTDGHFPLNLAWEVLHADTVVLLGLLHALSESYMGYLQCMYSLNSAHSKFSKLYKTVFPNGLEAFATPATTPAISREGSTLNLSVPSGASTPTSPSRRSFFGRWGSSSSSSSEKLTVPTTAPEGPLDELIISGASFGFGLFSLVISLLPAKVKTVVGFLGYTSDRKTALQALAVSAARTDVHAVFSGLILMTYHGVVLLMAGFQADEEHTVKQYRAIVDRVSARYPNGSLWILNRAKILRMTYDPNGAIEVLKEGLNPAIPGHFVQADALLVFELAWTLLSERRFEESADMFLRMTELNSWSHATYYMLAAGCHISVGNIERAKTLLQAVPNLLDKRKVHGKEMPMEVFIKRRLAFYKAKQLKRGGKEEDMVDCIKISPAEELGIFWNTHGRVSLTVAEAYVKDWTSLTPTIDPSSASPTTLTVSPTPTSDDLTTPDELAIRSLLLGIIYIRLSQFSLSRAFLEDAYKRYNDAEAKWVGGIAQFELAVLELKEAEAEGPDEKEDAMACRNHWKAALKGASDKLDKAISISGANVDLSSRLDSRINLLRDEIALKRENLGLSK